MTFVPEYTVANLEALAATAESNGDYRAAKLLMQKALYLARLQAEEGRESARWIGPCGYLPKIEQGMTVTIQKGTRMTGTFPDKLADGKLPSGRNYREAKKTYKVKVNHTFDGYVRDDHPHVNRGLGFYMENPRIAFAGVGGYWCDVDINDIPEAIEAMQRGDYRAVTYWSQFEPKPEEIGQIQPSDLPTS